MCVQVFLSRTRQITWFWTWFCCSSSSDWRHSGSSMVSETRSWTHKSCFFWMKRNSREPRAMSGNSWRRSFEKLSVHVDDRSNDSRKSWVNVIKSKIWGSEKNEILTEAVTWILCSSSWNENSFSFWKAENDKWVKCRCWRPWRGHMFQVSVRSCVQVSVSCDRVSLCLGPGWKGNLCERSLASCASLFILLPCGALAVYFLLLQTFVLRLEFILGAVLLCFYALELLLGLLSLSAFSRWTRPEAQISGGGQSPDQVFDSSATSGKFTLFVLLFCFCRSKVYWRTKFTWNRTWPQTHCKYKSQNLSDTNHLLLFCTKCFINVSMLPSRLCVNKFWFILDLYDEQICVFMWRVDRNQQLNIESPDLCLRPRVGMEVMHVIRSRFSGRKFLSDGRRLSDVWMRRHTSVLNCSTGREEIQIPGCWFYNEDEMKRTQPGTWIVQTQNFISTLKGIFLSCYYIYIIIIIQDISASFLEEVKMSRRLYSQSLIFVIFIFIYKYLL